MSQWRILSAMALVSSALLACSSSTPSAQSASSGGEGPLIDARELYGTWVEFWAVSGRADTQRYMFGADGTFEWHAAPGAETPGPVSRTGTWDLRSGELILTILREDPPPEGPRSREQQLPLGACPPDQEARALDTHYRCLSFNGRAFWRRP